MILSVGVGLQSLRGFSFNLRDKSFDLRDKSFEFFLRINRAEIKKLNCQVTYFFFTIGLLVKGSFSKT